MCEFYIVFYDQIYIINFAFYLYLYLHNIFTNLFIYLL